jgi:acetamidase/formamidase
VKVFERELTQTHCVGDLWPKFVGQGEVGESFVMETAPEASNGPVAVSGVKAGDNIAIHIENIEIVGDADGKPFTAPNGGPFHEGCGPGVPLKYRDGCFYWPGHFRLKACPSVGNVAVLPEPTEEILAMSREYDYDGRQWKNEAGWRRVVKQARDRHCHQDCWAITAGVVVHMKARVDGAGLCMSDVHAYIGQGEMAFAGIEVDARVQVKVERSGDWFIDWPLIETKDEIMVVTSFSTAYSHRPVLEYVDLVREAYRAIREVVAAKAGCTIEEANSIVATAVDVRNCAIYGLRGFITGEKTVMDFAVAACLPKYVFTAAGPNGDVPD